MVNIEMNRAEALRVVADIETPQRPTLEEILWFTSHAPFKLEGYLDGRNLTVRRLVLRRPTIADLVVLFNALTPTWVERRGRHVELSW